MFTLFFGPDDGNQPRQYENYVGSRFMMRVSHEMRTISHSLTRKLPHSSDRIRATTPLAPKTPFTSKNPTYEEVAGQSRPGMPSAILQIAFPGYDMDKHGQGLASKETRSFCAKVLFIIFACVAVFSVIVGLAVSLAFANAAQVNTAGFATSAPSSVPTSIFQTDTLTPTTEIEFLSTPSPIVPTPRPSRARLTVPTDFTNEYEI